MKFLKKIYRVISEEQLCLLVSFALPLFLLLIFFIIEGIAPFGDSTFCSMDGFSQYYPMLMNMGESLKEGEVFYSFSGALGFNLWAQSAYYTNSPLWLLVYLLPQGMKFTGIHFIILLKTCLSSLFFCVWLLKRSDRSENQSKFIYPCLSFAWALSTYYVAFINQFMWADVFMLLPLVILGIDYLINGKGNILYISALALSIWCCFYLAYMVCIFAVLFFLYTLFKKERVRKNILHAFLNFTLSSLIAGGICALSLIPVAKALSLTAASEVAFPRNLELRYTILEFLRQLLPFAEISLEYGAPNLYCSLTAVIAMLLSFLCRSISIREKILSFSFVTFISLTMSINIGEYIWHGFHFPNQLPARQSFLLIFLILSLAAQGLEKSKLKQGIKIGAAMCIIIGISATSVYQLTNQTWISKTTSLQANDQRAAILKSEKKGELFARRDWANVKKNNFPQQHHYNGITYYSSTMSGDAWRFFQNLGMEYYADKVSVYYTHSDIVSSLLGIRYIMNEEGTEISTNKKALSLAYLSSSDILSFKIGDYEKGEKTQKALLNAIALDKNEKEEKILLRLKKNELKISSFDTDIIEGTIRCETEGVFLTTLPFDGGWDIFIDGEKAETVKVAEYLTACKIEKGEHEIEMRYTVPGIISGGIISGISLICFIVIIYFEIKKKREEV